MGQIGIIADNCDSGDRREGNKSVLYMPASFSAGNFVVTVSSTAPLNNGMSFVGFGIPTGTTILFKLSSTTFETSKFTASGSSGVYGFYENLNLSETDSQGAASSERNAFQKNVSAVDNINGLENDFFGYTFSNCNPTWPNFGGQFISLSDAVIIQFLCPDMFGGTGGETTYFSPPNSGSSVAANNFAHANVFNVMSPTTNLLVSPQDAPSSPNFPNYQLGSICLSAGNTIECRFARLLPQGTYTVHWGSGFNSPWTAIAGWSANFYYSTAAGDTLIQSLDDTGTPTCGLNTPYTFTIPAPWAWIKIVINNLSPFQNGAYGSAMLLDSYTP